MSNSSKQGAGSHKAFQPVLPCGNKMLQQKWDATYYKEHRKLIKSAKPMVDTKAPPKRPHMASKKKKQQMEKERLDEIDRDNFNLLKKMERIMDTEGSVDHRNSYKHHSLNELKRQRELERVASENRAMLKRLQGVEPTYKMSDWIDDWHKKALMTEMITSYPNGPPVTMIRKSMEDTGPVDVIRDSDTSTGELNDQTSTSPVVIDKELPVGAGTETPSSPVGAGKETPSSPVGAGKEMSSSPVEAGKETSTSCSPLGAGKEMPTSPVGTGKETPASPVGTGEETPA